MKRKIVRLTESDLHRIVENSVKRVLREGIYDNSNDEDDDFNPWIDGTASWIDGEYDIPYGFHVSIDTRYSTVSIENEKEDESYFLQGDEADDLIKDISRYWKNNNVSQEKAVNDVISGYF